MVVKKPGKVWADPNREGRSQGKEAERFCSKCGNTVQQARILKSLNLCEYCVKELREKKDGVTSCRGCGRIAPLELKAHNGFCIECICGACGKPDPSYVRKTGLCFQCAAILGDFCRSCGKEAPAQVRKNKGFCDDCFIDNKHKTLGRHRRSSGYQGKHFGGSGTKPGNLGSVHGQTTVGRIGAKSSFNKNKQEKPVVRGGKPFPGQSGDQKQPVVNKPGLRNSGTDRKSIKSNDSRNKPAIAMITKG